MRLLDGGRLLRFEPGPEALQPGTSYVATLAGRPADALGQAARTQQGTAWTQAQSTFTTSSIAIRTFVGGHPSANLAVEGHALSVLLAAQTGAPLFRGT